MPARSYFDYVPMIFRPNLNDPQRRTRERFLLLSHRKKMAITSISYLQSTYELSYQYCKTLSSENSIQRILYLIWMVKMFTHDSTHIRRWVYIYTLYTIYFVNCTNIRYLFTSGWRIEGSCPKQYYYPFITKILFNSLRNWENS